MTSAMSSLFRRSFRLSRFSSPAPKQHQALFYSSLLSSPSSPSSSSLRKFIPNTSKPSLFLPFRPASSAPLKVGADENLQRVLQSEIRCAEESDESNQGGVLPNELPFEIIDNPGEQIIILKREFAGESIQVEVHMPDMMEEDDEDGSDGKENDEDSVQPSISLIVTVSKGEGPCLSFCCTAYADEITIDSMLMKQPEGSSDEIAYEGPEFSDLDENLQKALYNYLEVRGIKSSLTNFLHEYMVNKDSREYLGWLKNMKEFIET